MAKEVEVIAWFDKEGTVKPIKVRLEENDEIQVIAIKNILKKEYEKLAGNHMWKLTCSSDIDGVQKNFVLKFELMTSKWYLFV
ncbi:MAG: hypothetical protein RR620_08900 [Clostridium sp.]